jgi:predicted HicB family RNase H-like nuclease
MTNKYTFNIAWSEEDGEYVATCPAFPGLSAYGKSEETALAEAKVALVLFIKSCTENGIPLPEPQTAQDYSGQFRVRIPKTLHAQAARMAEQEETSLNQFVLDAISERVGGQKFHDRTLKELRRAISELALQQSYASQSLSFQESQTEGEEMLDVLFKLQRTAVSRGAKEKRGT